MKTFLKISAAAAVIATASSAIAAPYTVRLTGATAFRNSSNSAILSMFGGEANTKIVHNNGGPATGTTLAQLNGATKAIFQGTYNGDLVTVKIVWTGSVGGLRSAADQTPLGCLPDSEIPATAGFANAKRLASSFAGVESPNLTADFAFSDVRQENTNANTSPALPEPTPVGVVPFTFMCNPTTPAGITNMDGQKARLLFTNGFARTFIWTGNFADQTPVVITGRNDESGTRAEVLAETQYGVFTPIRQFYASNVLLTGGGDDNEINPVAGGSITELRLWPAASNTTFWASAPWSGTPYGMSVNTSEGNGGYISSSRTANILTKTSATVTTAASTPSRHPQVSSGVCGVISYGDMTTWRAVEIAATGGRRLSYEGVSYDDSATDAEKIYNGLYTYWSYEQLYEKNGLDASLVQFRDDLVINIQTGLGPLTAGLSIDNMNVVRDTDGGLVGPN